MGRVCFEILNMIFFFFFIINFMLPPLNAAGSFNTVINGGSEEKQVMMLEKFRVLLGLNSFKRKNPNFGVDFINGSPSSSPSPSPAIKAHTRAHAPVPVLSILTHSHPPLSPHHPQTHKGIPIKKHKNGTFTRNLVAIVVSATFGFVLCILGVILFCRKYRKPRKKSSKTRSILKGSRGKKSVSKKVSFNPGMDLFYLNSIDLDLEQHHSTTTCFKQETCDTFSCKINPTNFEESEQLEAMNLDLEDGNNESSSRINDEIVVLRVESHSSDDESFHSLNDRLSNASASSFREALHENMSPPPPPPPPPPQPPQSLNSFTCSSTRINIKRMNSNSSRDSNQTPQSESPYTRPNSGMDTTPPPPPPPLMKGNGSFMKTLPPPLPCQITPLGKDGAPLPKLRPLHWDKVRATPDRSMVWDKLKSSSFEFDEKMIESLFGYTSQNAMKNDEGKSRSPSPSKHVLEPKRLQNLTILLKALNVTSDHVCGALIQGDGLSLQQLEALVKMVPTKEEEVKFYSFKGHINELGLAEKFVKAILDVPFAFLRIEAMLFKETFEDEVHHLKKSFSMLEEACKELRSSRLFLKLLEAVLKTGNRMNVGTIRGGAKAFKLDALLKLSDIKGTDGKTTLLHFVVQEMIRSEGIKKSETIISRMNNRKKTIKEREEEYKKMGLDLVLELSNELSNVKRTATIDLDVLASSVSCLEDGILKVENLVQNQLSSDVSNGNFMESMRDFLGYGEKMLKELKKDEREVFEHVKEVTEYFHGINVSKDEANPLRIFVIVRDFLSVLDHVCKELRTLKIASSLSPPPFK